jgi:phenylpropionate dioxygenase-like ring-hydroxylating dioxygenase large terminal subunit
MLHRSIDGGEAMQHGAQVALTRRLIELAERGATELGDSVFHNPVSSYTCPRQAEREREVLFRGQPLFFGMSCELPKPGDFRADDLSGVPILVVRNGDGKLNAFLNVCRHRGAKVADGRGSGRRLFTCPYHAWSYDLDGRLTRLAPATGFPGLACAEHSLVPLPVAEKHGLIFVKAAPGGEIDVDTLLGGLGPELAAYGFDRYSHFTTQALARDMNWKLVIDTFLETWHVAILHKATIASIFQPNVNAFDAFGRHGRITLPRRSLIENAKEPESRWDLLTHSAIIYQLFPNTILIWQGDHVETWRAFPVGGATDRCVAEAALLAPEPAVTDKAKGHWQRNMDLLMRTVDTEDFPVCQDIQRGFTSGAQTHITFGRNEPALAHYHHGIQEAVG